MRHVFREFDGRPFAFSDDLNLADNFFDLILAYGHEGLRALHELEDDPEQSEMLQQLLEQGLLDKVRGRWRLTPRAVHAMQRRALMEIFASLRKGTRDGHVSPDQGGGADRIEGTRPFQFGDPVSELDLSATLRNTLARTTAEQSRAAQPSNESGSRPSHAGQPLQRRAGAGLLPLRIQEADLERHNSESRTSCSTVILLDMSGSMARYHRFFHAKKCAMALQALIRQRFPMDTVDLVGFFSGAERLAEEKLPLAMPKPVTLFEGHVRLQTPLDRLDRAPQHFTNLHMGLMLARRILARRSGENKMMFIITDGQPTAHVQGDYAHLIYPPHPSSHVATLKEALIIAHSGIRVCTFALTDDYWDMDWLGFVDDLGRVTRGVIFQCTSGDLSNCVMQSYLTGRRKKAYLA